MTLKQLYIKQFGKRDFQKLSPRIKKAILSIDALEINKKPVPRRLIEKALA